MRQLEARLIEDVRALRARDPRGALLLVVPSRLLGRASEPAWPARSVESRGSTS